MTVIVVDTSAVVAVLQGEAGHAELKGHLESAGQRLMSAATFVELSAVVESRYREDGRSLVERFISDAEIEIVPLTEDQAGRACDGWRRFGKGRGHPAQLNLGDCFSYGLAAATGCPLLCTGNDFAQTDIDVLRPEQA